jgi:hypothetical protein
MKLIKSVIPANKVDDVVPSNVLRSPRLAGRHVASVD